MLAAAYCESLELQKRARGGLQKARCWVASANSCKSLFVLLRGAWRVHIIGTNRLGHTGSISDSGFRA